MHKKSSHKINKLLISKKNVGWMPQNAYYLYFFKENATDFLNIASDNDT